MRTVLVLQVGLYSYPCSRQIARQYIIIISSHLTLHNFCILLHINPCISEQNKHSCPQGCYSVIMKLFNVCYLLLSQLLVLSWNFVTSFILFRSLCWSWMRRQYKCVFMFMFREGERPWTGHVLCSCLQLTGTADSLILMEVFSVIMLTILSCVDRFSLACLSFVIIQF